jgi:hypothetical protein
MAYSDLQSVARSTETGKACTDILKDCFERRNVDGKGYTCALEHGCHFDRLKADKLCGAPAPGNVVFQEVEWKATDEIRDLYSKDRSTGLCGAPAPGNSIDQQVEEPKTELDKVYERYQTGDECNCPLCHSLRAHGMSLQGIDNNGNEQFWGPSLIETRRMYSDVPGSPDIESRTKSPIYDRYAKEEDVE